MAKKQKKIIANVKFRVPAGNATPGPPVGSTLGQYGVNSQDFIQAFNAQTSDLKGQGEIGVHMSIHDDRTFTFRTNGVATDVLILKTLGIKKGSGVPQKDKIGKLTQTQLKDIAEAKMIDMNCDTVESAMKAVAGTARSMGVEIEA